MQPPSHVVRTKSHQHSQSCLQGIYMMLCSTSATAVSLLRCGPRPASLSMYLKRNHSSSLSECAGCHSSCRCAHHPTTKAAQPHLEATDHRLDQPSHACAGMGGASHLDVALAAQLLLPAAHCTADQPWAAPGPADLQQPTPANWRCGLFWLLAVLLAVNAACAGPC